LRVELDRKNADERKRLLQKMKDQEIKEAHMLQRRQDQVTEIRDRNAAKAAETERRFAVSRAKSIEAAEEKRRNMLQKDAEAEIRINNLTRERDERIVGKQRAKSAAQAERYSAASRVLDAQRQERRESMAQKEWEADERKRQQMEDRMKEIHDMEQNRLQKLNRAQESLSSIQKERTEAGERAKERWGRDDDRAEEAKSQHDTEVHDRAELQKLKEELQAENAERVRKMRQLHLQEKGEEAQERQTRAHLYLENQQVLALRKREQKTKLDFEKAALISEFKENLRKGGNVNVEVLAKKFGLDLDELRKRVGE
jgi:hypothetical protein